MNLLLPLLATLAAYLIGSLSFAVIVSRAFRLQDPRTFGSGNPGATNVLRSGNKAAAALTLILDAAKGWLPVVLVRWFGAPHGLGDGTVALVGLAAFVGHLYPVFFGFRGGKGVATALGVLLGFHAWLGLAAAASWLIIAFFLRLSSLAALVAAAFTPIYYFFGGDIAWRFNGAIFGMLCLMALLLAWRHRQNLDRLIKGTEPRIGGGRKG